MSGGRVVGGTVWTVGGYAASQVFRFGFNVALAQMVAPKVLGVMALVGLIAQGIQMFSDLGIRQCIIQHARGGDVAFLNTAWTVQVIRGTVLWIGSALLAWPMAAFYAEPALLWLIPLTGTAAFITGFSSTALWTYSRDVRRGPLVRREVGVYIGAYTTVLVVIAFIRERWPGGEARTLELAVIAMCAVVAAIGEVVLSYTLRALVRHRFAWDAEAQRELIRFGGWVFVSSGCTFFAAQADRLIVGKLSLDVLGVYHIAVVIAALPAGVLAALGAQLVFPLMSDATRQGQPMALVFLRAHRALILAAGLLITGMACVGPAFVRFLYNDQYAAAAGFIRLLAVSAWVTSLIIPGELALLALGQTRALATAQGVRLLCVPGLLLGGYSIGGIPGLILGVAAGELIRYCVIAIFLKRAGLKVVAEDIALTLFVGGLLGLYLLVEEFSGEAGKIAVPIAGGTIQILIWASISAVWIGPENGRSWIRCRMVKCRTATERGQS
ncbi:MAG: oligosaccharide flippase family protein [Planctomycetes bacterium]|nr:oligosaccharide flippase family protein [Planctomycetota bacterium]